MKVAGLPRLPNRPAEHRPCCLRYYFSSRCMEGLLQSHRWQSSCLTSGTFPKAKVLSQGSYLRQQLGPRGRRVVGSQPGKTQQRPRRWVNLGEHQQNNGRTKDVATRARRASAGSLCDPGQVTQLSFSCSSVKLCCESPHPQPTGL